MTDTTLDGATTPAGPGEYPTDAGGFAATWNAHDPEWRDERVTVMVENAELATNCIVTDHRGRIAYLESVTTSPDVVALRAELATTQALLANLHEILTNPTEDTTETTNVHEYLATRATAANRAAELLADRHAAGPAALAAVMRSAVEEAGRSSSPWEVTTDALDWRGADPVLANQAAALIESSLVTGYLPLSARYGIAHVLLRAGWRPTEGGEQA